MVSRFLDISDDQFSINTQLFYSILQTHSAQITLRTRKLTTNRLLGRRQCIIDIGHPSRPNVSRSILAEKLAHLYKTESSRVAVFGMRILLGGRKSTGYALIYDNEDAQRRHEPKYRLIRVRGSTVFAIFN